MVKSRRRPAVVRATLAPISGPGAQLARGELMGWFNMGSTVVLLFPKERVRWQAQLAAGMKVRVGQPLGQILELP